MLQTAHTACLLPEQPQKQHFSDILCPSQMETVQKTAQKRAKTEGKADKTSPHFSFSISIRLLLNGRPLRSITFVEELWVGFFFLLLVQLKIFSLQCLWGKIWADSIHTHSPSGESFYVAVWVSVNPNRRRLPAACTVQSFVLEGNGEKKKTAVECRIIPSLPMAGVLFMSLFLAFVNDCSMTASLCMILPRLLHTFVISRLMKCWNKKVHHKPALLCILQYSKTSWWMKPSVCLLQSYI